MRPVSCDQIIKLYKNNLLRFYLLIFLKPFFSIDESVGRLEKPYALVSV